MVGVALDVETTGLDHRRHEVIEFAAQRFRLDDFGRIVETGRPRSWLEQPSEPIPVAITRVTGIADPDVAGRSISDGEAAGMILGSDFVISHNAAFDRPFTEKRLPMVAGRPWVCSLADFDWWEAGYEGRTLSALLGRMGWFYDPHRAETDVTALLHLLDHPLDDGGTVMAGQVVLLLSSAHTGDGVLEALRPRIGAEYVLISENRSERGGRGDDAIVLGGRRYERSLYGQEINRTRIERVG